MLLRFKVSDLMPLVRHAESATEWRKDYDGKSVGPALLLVHDDGIYMMSSGLPHQPNASKPDHCHVVYATGFRPEDGHVGGDDYVEYLRLDEFRKFLAAETIDIIMTPEHMTIEARGPAPAPRHPQRPRPPRRRRNDS